MGTQTPWHAVAIAGGKIIGDENAQGAEKIQIHGSNATVATVYRPADARTICTAVNSHPALVAACESALSEAALHEKADENMARLCDQLRAAIAKAKGGAA